MGRVRREFERRVLLTGLITNFGLNTAVKTVVSYLSISAKHGKPQEANTGKNGNTSDLVSCHRQERQH